MQRTTVMATEEHILFSAGKKHRGTTWFVLKSIAIYWDGQLKLLSFTVYVLLYTLEYTVENTPDR